MKGPEGGPEALTYLAPECPAEATRSRVPYLCVPESLPYHLCVPESPRGELEREERCYGQSDLLETLIYRHCPFLAAPSQACLCCSRRWT